MTIGPTQETGDKRMVIPVYGTVHTCVWKVCSFQWRIEDIKTGIDEENSHLAGLGIQTALEITGIVAMSMVANMDSVDAKQGETISGLMTPAAGDTSLPGNFSAFLYALRKHQLRCYV